MPTVIINAFADLRQYTAGRPTIELEVPAGGTIRSVLEQIGIPVDETRIVFINSRIAGLDDALRGGEKIDLFSAIGGG